MYIAEYIVKNLILNNSPKRWLRGIIRLFCSCKRIVGICYNFFHVFFHLRGCNALLQLVIFHDQFCFVHLDLKTVCSVGIAGAGDKYAGCTVGVFHISGNIVLYFNVVPLAVVQMRGDVDGHAADPLPQIQLMGALVQQNTAAFSCPGSTPITGIVIRLAAIPVGDQPVGAANASVFSGVYKFTHFAVDAVGSLVEHQTKYDLRVLGCFFVHFTDLLGIDTGRFFHHDMNAAFHTFDGEGGVVIVRRANKAGVNKSAVQHSDGIFEANDPLVKIFFCRFYTNWQRECRQL